MLEDNFVKCRDGKDREIFPALIKHKNKIRHFALKFKSDMTIVNLIAPDTEKLKKAGENVKGLEAFSDEPYDALMEMLVLAFGEQYTKKEIESFVDVEMVPDIIDIFFGISGYKKKVMKDNQMFHGMSSVQALLPTQA